MSRLMRWLVEAMARGLRAIAGRLTPAGVAPVAEAEAPAVDDAAGGAPRHWLEMVRTRAPGLHVSLQERGLARPARHPRATAPVAPAPREAAPSALEPRHGRSPAPARPESPAAPLKRLPVAHPARPVATTASALPTQRPSDPHPDLEPQAWASAAGDDEQEDWTRVPRSVRSAPSAASAEDHAPVAVAGRPGEADAAVAGNRRPSAAAPARAARHEPARPDVGNDGRDPAAPPELRPRPSPVPVEAPRHGSATPVLAPAREQDPGLRRPLRARVDHRTPEPTPWRSDALPAAADGSALPRFPALPDEPSAGAPRSRPERRPPLAAATAPGSAHSPSAPARRHHRPHDLVDAWPTLPLAHTPPLHLASAGPSADSWPASPEADRWPELPEDESGDGNDPELSLPAGHRERLAREQRGLSWNG